jgi:hypothetical protein
MRSRFDYHSETHWGTIALWAALALTCISYTVTTGMTIAANGTRVSVLENVAKEASQERKDVLESLRLIDTNLAELKAEQRILHGRSPSERPGER